MEDVSGSHDNLNQVYLMTSDLERARAFYEEVIGLDPVRIGDTSVSYETGACELKIQADFGEETLEPFGLEPPPASGRGAGAIYVLHTEVDIDEVHRTASGRVNDLGGEILTNPQDVSWGGRMFLVRSPNGYVFEIRDETE